MNLEFAQPVALKLSSMQSKSAQTAQVVLWNRRLRIQPLKMERKQPLNLMHKTCLLGRVLCLDDRCNRINHFIGDICSQQITDVLCVSPTSYIVIHECSNLVE